MNNQGRSERQIDFSDKMVTFGYYGVLLCIVGFILYEYFT